MTRVLFTACPLYGHVNTVLPLALAARRAGHDVAVATGADLAGRVEAAGLTAWPVGPTAAEAGRPTAPEWFLTTGELRAKDLLPRADDWRPDVVVSEETEIAGLLAAPRARHLVHGLGIAAAGSPEVFGALVTAIGEQWGRPGLLDVASGAEYVSICPPALGPPARARVQQVRPTLPPAGPDERLPAAVTDARRPVVHLTLGTVYHARDVLAAAAAGLAELPVDVVVTTGPGTAGLGPQPGHVLVAPYLPHALLLPRCTLVVSQGGAGILFGALAHGLPQLVLPQAADQPANAAAAAATGAALTLAKGEVTATAVAAAAERLLTRPEHRAAAAAVQAEISAMPSPDEAWAAIEG